MGGFEFGAAAVVLLAVGLTHVDDVSAGHQRLGWTAIALGAVCLVVCAVLARYEDGS